MKLLYILLLISGFELPAGAQAQINLHIHNNTSVILKSPKIYLISAPWWILSPEEASMNQNIQPVKKK